MTQVKLIKVNIIKRNGSLIFLQVLKILAEFVCISKYELIFAAVLKKTGFWRGSSAG